MTQEWYSANDLAALKLRGLPSSKRRINDLAGEQGWAFKSDASGSPLARPRKKRGGGKEYHFSLLPLLAQVDLGFASEPPAEQSTKHHELGFGSAHRPLCLHLTITVEIKPFEDASIGGTQ